MAQETARGNGNGDQAYDNDSLKFAALMAHQMQSPLSTVSQSLQALLGEYAGPISATQRGTLERADARCRQAMTAVRRMLGIIQAHSGRGADSTPSPLAAVVRQVHLQYVEPATLRGIDFVLELDTENEYVAVAEATLTEILVALLDNAMKYTPDHGRIRIRSTRQDDDWLLLAVADSGLGISAEDRQRVFDPFFRSKQAMQSGSGGVGLGLAFVKGMVTASGGSIEIADADVGGAEFLVRLPIAEETSPETAMPGTRKATFHVVIIGGVAAGPKAAAKIIRLRSDAEVTVIDRGSVLSYAGCGLPYYVSGVVRDQKTLISSPAGVVRDPIFFRNVKNVHVMNQTEALEIDRACKRVLIRNNASGKDIWQPYDKLLLATGAKPIIPAAFSRPMSNVFTLHGVRDAEGIRAALASRGARNIVIVGGGLIGIEMTEALVRKGARVTILERYNHVLSIVDPEIAMLLERHLESQGVRIVTGVQGLRFEGEELVTGVITTAGTYAADMVILAMGVMPNVELARRAGLSIGESGALWVNDRMCTSDPDIYAAGDCVETRHLVTGKACYVPLGSTANKQGRIAAVNLCGGSDKFPGILGSCICKVFHYAVGRTGLGENDARAAGYDVLTVLVPGPDREHFVPNVELVLMKLIVDRASRRLLGLQATGPGAIDKRIDVAAMAIAAGLTVDALSTVDLCYAPPYSPAMDNVITAANVARNILDGHMCGIKPAEVQRMLRDHEDFVFLDVRNPEEYEHRHLPYAQLVPLGSLRGRLATLPKDKPIVTYCDISLRGYEAALILSAAGFPDVRVMEGGIAMWPFDAIE